MKSTAAYLEARLATFVEYHVLYGERLPVAHLCADRPALLEPLRQLIDQYLSLTAALTPPAEVSDAEEAEAAEASEAAAEITGPSPNAEPAPATVAVPEAEAVKAATLPQFAGFQTIERLGGGGMGEIYKLKDLQLDRIVAGKTVRRDRRVTGVTEFLQEARALALFSDPRIVRILEFRAGNPALIVMELVEGFELGRIGPSLEFTQRARVLAEVCDAVQHAHGLGIQHRDLKPSNIMVDAGLTPRILDFGLSAGDPKRGHLKGTVRYLAPEQLNPAKPIDDRTDVYALGVILYELLCGRRPYEGSTDREIVAAIRRGHPQLPIEIDPQVPEPLQAIALKAMEGDPALRYQSASDMATDLRRHLDGRPVSARPSIYATTLGTRTAAHVQQIAEWLQLRLIHPHEADRLRRAYDTLQASEDDWIVESRALSFTQIALYLGAFLLICGSLFFFVADRWYHSVEGIARPVAVLGLPFLGLNAAAHLLLRRDHKVVAVAFYLAAVALLPLLLMIVFHETGLLVVAPGTVGQLFQNGSVSNHQLQITTALACVWCAALAVSTETVALSTVFVTMAFIFAASLAGDFGLRSWIEEGRWDLVAVQFAPLIMIYVALGAGVELANRTWLSRPLYRGAAVLFVVLLELLALDGRMFHYLGISLQPWQSSGVTDPLLADTVAAMTLNGLIFYIVAVVTRLAGSELMATAGGLLFAISPFAVLQPLAYLVRTGEYSLRYDWIYLALAVAVTLLSQQRQRKSFYYAGLLNTGAALYLIAVHRHWLERPVWGTTLIVIGLLTLLLGFGLDRYSRRARTRSSA
jgi:serine/threonine-protein kinase